MSVLLLARDVASHFFAAPSASQSRRHLVAQAVSMQSREEDYQGRTHLVVPVVAMVGDIVTTGILADGPEFIPASVLAETASAWDGRPIIAYHPLAEGTANTPTLWQRDVFGQVFNAEFSDNRLRMEAWIDIAAAERVGGDAAEVLQLLRDGAIVEVSIGALALVRDQSGMSPAGEEYSARWEVIIPDHLAIGLQQHGSVGACSAEMGCGANRYMANTKEIPVRNLGHNFLALVVATAARANTKLNIAAEVAGLSNYELRNALAQALRATVPAFYDVYDIYTDDKTAIFWTYPGDSLLWWQCSYAVGADGTVSVDGIAEVRMTTTYVPVAQAPQAMGDAAPAGAPVSALAPVAACSCSHPSDGNIAVSAAQSGEGDSMNQRITELVGRLVAHADTPFNDTHKDALSGLDEATLVAMCDSADKPAAPAPEAAVAAPAPVQDPNVVTIERTQLARLQAMAARDEAREKAERSALITALTGAQANSGRTVYTPQALAAMPTDQLQSLAAFAGLEEVDYSGRGFAISQQASDAEVDHTPPDAWALDAKSPAAKPS